MTLDDGNRFAGGGKARRQRGTGLPTTDYNGIVLAIHPMVTRAASITKSSYFSADKSIAADKSFSHRAPP
jgi:hypothetical protein